MTRAGVLAAAVVAAVVASAAPVGATGGSSRPASMGAAPDDGSARARADTVIGNGTPGSCTSARVVRAVAEGGTIAFSCGPDPVTIVMKRTAKVVNTSPKVVLDGGGTVTLSGGGQRRILYMNTCDRAQVWTTSHCNDQPERSWW